MKGLTEIKIQEQLGPGWEDYFDGMTIRYEDHSTILRVRIKDQAHLHGILLRIRDLNLRLVSVNILDSG